MTDSKTLLIGNADADSASPAILLNYYGEIDYRQIMIEYDELKNAGIRRYILSYPKVLFVDFSPDEDLFDSLQSKQRHVEIYDHHRSDLNRFLWDNPTVNTYLDLYKCGGMIFYENYCIPQYGEGKPAVREFINLINAYDLWLEDSPLWEEALNLYRVCYGQINYSASQSIERFEPFIRKQSRKLRGKKEHFFWTTHELDLIERSKSREDSAYEDALSSMDIREDNAGRKFGLIILGTKVSMVANRLLNENPELSYICIINTYNGLSGKLSFRSLKGSGFDCRKIQIADGHENAAGAMIDQSLLYDLMYDREYSFEVDDV